MITQLLTDEEKRLTPKGVLHHPWMDKFLKKENDKPFLNSKHIESMKKFEKSTKLKKAALTYLASRTKDRDISEEMKIF